MNDQTKTDDRTDQGRSDQSRSDQSRSDQGRSDQGLSPREIQIREVRRSEMAETSFSKTPQGGAMMLPNNPRDLMDFANMMAASGPMVRDFYRNNPGACAGLIMICQPYGFNPFLVNWKTYRASKDDNAPIAFEAQLINAMVKASAPIKGHFQYTFGGEGESRFVKVVGIDRLSGEALEYISPPKATIAVKNSPLWKGDLDQQLCFYGVRAWCRRWFPELLLGMYSREEIETAEPRDVTPKETGFTAMAREARESKGVIDEQRQKIRQGPLASAGDQSREVAAAFESGKLVASETNVTR